MLLSSIFFFIVIKMHYLLDEIVLFYILDRDISIIILHIFINNNLFITYLDNGVGLFGGLFYTSSITQSFHILIFIISLLILNITGFYPRKFIGR